MPFIVRCPHCRRFMLIEDELRGATGECLLCKQAVHYDSAAPPADPGQKLAARPPAPATGGETETYACPNCQVKMRVPSSARGKKIRCPKCSHESRWT